ncbi:hypothetical protein PRZ48_003436 [Zasmidium cellare]|uniref:Major facilitator superfamily (MFS) profile domain-containing protein n=1 Tax=Zasmidium cellare TaxID=395010 RepID=A0ABR0EWC3_ZASCE|nr:hypothetical protein PRZ48_003436 [Zasmidium cellare]
MRSNFTEALPASTEKHSKQNDDDKTNPDYLTGWKMFAAVISLNAANGVAFIDLLGVTAILPAVSVHFDSGGPIAWAATTQLIGATVGLAILGYLSDVWSRRMMLLVALGLLTASALACGLSSYQQSTDLFCALRTFSGIATGSVSNLVNIAQNDFLPERKRLKYQGIQGTSVALGSITGMLVGAALAMNGIWEVFYYIEVGLSVVASSAVFLFVPANCTPPKRQQIWEAVRTIDFLGIISGIGVVVPGLLLLCKYYLLQQAVLIAMGVIAGISLIVFLFLGFKTNRGSVRPLVPFRLFRNRTIATILIQNILFGAAYYSFSYYLPLNLQVVREMPEIEASAMQVPYYVCHGAWSTGSALIILKLQKMKKRSYSTIFLVGFAVWTLAMVLLGVDSEQRVPGLVAILGVLVGIGTGSSFQNSVMAISAQVDKETKGVAVGTRNVLRFFGGALGTAISSTILRDRLIATLPNEIDYLAESTFSPSLFELTEQDQVAAQEAFDGAIAFVFYISAAMVGVCFLLCPLIRDNKTGKPTDEEEIVGMKTTPPEQDDSASETRQDEDDVDSKKSSLDIPNERQAVPFETTFHRPVSVPGAV